MYALLSRVSAEQARFLMLVLEHNLKARSETGKQDLDGVAEQANSAGEQEIFPVSGFTNVSPQHNNGNFRNFYCSHMFVSGDVE